MISKTIADKKLGDIRIIISMLCVIATYLEDVNTQSSITIFKS